MDWFKKHADTAVVLGAIVFVFLWMDFRFNRIEKRLVIIETALLEWAMKK